MGFWCESFAFAQVGVCRNNSSQGHAFKYHPSSFCDAAAGPVLEAFGAVLGGAWRPPKSCAVGGRASARFVGDWEAAGPGLPCAYFQGRQAVPESGGEFGGVVPILVSRRRPTVEGVGSPIFFVSARRVWTPNAFCDAVFHVLGAWVWVHARVFSWIVRADSTCAVSTACAQRRARCVTRARQMGYILQVLLYWGWCNAAYDTSGARKVVWINVDETSIQFGYNKKKGTVLKGSSWPDVAATVSPTTMHERFSLSDVRARVSYIAAAANDLEVQRSLPQVLLMNTRFATKKLLAHAQEIIPDNCHVWVADSAWLSAEKFLSYLATLHEAVQQAAKDRLIVVVLDSLSCHMNEDIANFASSVGIIVILIPGGLTWLLQVLDVYAFAKFKHSLQTRLCEERAEAEDGQLNKEMWLNEAEHNN